MGSTLDDAGEIDAKDGIFPQARMLRRGSGNTSIKPRHAQFCIEHEGHRFRLRE